MLKVFKSQGQPKVRDSATGGGYRDWRSRCQRYEDLLQLGKGGQGSIYLARDKNTNEPVAVKKQKLVDWEPSTETGRQEREWDPLRNEHEFLQRLAPQSTSEEANPYVIEYIEAFEVPIYKTKNKQKKKKAFLRKGVVDHVQLWIVQEFCEFGDLGDVAQMLNRNFTLPEIRRLTANVVLGLKHIHGRKVVHKDLKCYNILLTRAGRVKICDFGHSEVYVPQKKHCAFNNKTTLLWMAPEMYQDQAHWGYEVDIWALGVTLVEMFTGDPPLMNYEYDNLMDGLYMNLSSQEMQPSQYRRLLNLPEPPEDLVNLSTGRNNNYWQFGENVDEQFQRRARQSYLYKRKYSEPEEEEDFDPLVDAKQFAQLRSVNSVADQSTLMTTANSTKKRAKSAISLGGKKERKGSMMKMIFNNKKRQSRNEPDRKKSLLQTIKGHLFQKRGTRGALDLSDGLLISSEEDEESDDDSGAVVQEIDEEEYRAKKESWEKRHSYKQLEQHSEEVQFWEFVAWCLSQDPRQRPTAVELTEHPFIRAQVESLLRHEQSVCSIREHSDFLMRKDDFNDKQLRDEEEEENESDDDCYLSPEQLAAERAFDDEIGEANVDVCTCSDTQAYIRNNLLTQIPVKYKEALDDLNRRRLYYAEDMKAED